jgi:hypothetical protein
MTDEHREALEAFLRIFDERTAAAPVMDRRVSPPATEIVTARRAKGPVEGDFAYWVSEDNEGD